MMHERRCRPSEAFGQRRECGHALLLVLVLITALASVAGAILNNTVRTHSRLSHVASWQESIIASEAGADMAMASLRRTLIDPTTAFVGWSTKDAQDVDLPHKGRRYVAPALIHGGEQNTRLDVEVILDEPPSLKDPANVNQWRRIRSTGIAYLPGAAYVASDKRDQSLRRLSFLSFMRDGKRTDVSRAQARRYTELVAKPVGFESAIVSDREMNLNNFKIEVDSYDSRYPTKSTNGLYDPAKKQRNGDIATNSKLIDAGSALILGDAYTNDGAIINGANITGEKRHDFYQELIPVQRPTWTNIQVTPTQVTTTETLRGNPDRNAPTRYKLTRINLEGTNKLTIAPPVGTAAGVETFVEIWLTGDLRTSGGGNIVVEKGANLKIFIEGDVDIKGNGTFNENSQPSRLQILGVRPTALPGAEPAPRNMYFSGNGVFVGAVYAPNHNIEFGSTGSNGTYWGSLTGRSIKMGGSSVIHYDEALADDGYTTDFRIKSWFEDNR